MPLIRQPDDRLTQREVLSAGLLRLLAGVFVVQAGYHAFTGSLPVAMANASLTDAEIGLIVGAAALAQIPAALLSASLIDKFGGRPLLLLGAAAYALGACALLAPGVETGEANVWFLVARLLQGVGLGVVIPASLATAANLVHSRRRGLGLGLASSANNLALTIFPSVSLAILAAGSLSAVAASTIVVVGLGAGLLCLLPRRPTERGSRAGASFWRALHHLRWRREWAIPLAATALFAIYWGVVMAYLPQRAEAAGTNVGIFFALDGITILVLRTPAGWLTDRMRPHRLVIASVAAGVATMILLLPTPTAGSLAVAGLTSGIGAGLFFTVLLAEMGRRSDSADRGSAFALLSAAQAAAWLLGSAGTAALVDLGGFAMAVAVSAVGMLAAGALTLADPDLGGGPGWAHRA